MKVVVFESSNWVVKRAAKIVAESIAQKPNLVLGLATGSSVVGFYRELIKLYKKSLVDFSKVRTFNLDEYIGLSSGDKNSYRRFMEGHSLIQARTNQQLEKDQRRKTRNDPIQRRTH